MNVISESGVVDKKLGARLSSSISSEYADLATSPERIKLALTNLAVITVSAMIVFVLVQFLVGQLMLNYAAPPLNGDQAYTQMVAINFIALSSSGILVLLLAVGTKTPISHYIFNARVVDIDSFGEISWRQRAGRVVCKLLAFTTPVILFYTIKKDGIPIIDSWLGCTVVVFRKVVVEDAPMPDVEERVTLDDTEPTNESTSTLVS